MASERIIPLRVIQAVDSTSAPDNMTYANLLRRVDAMNEVFKAAGVQFWLKSNERWVSPSFYDINPQVYVPWSQVKSEFQLIFPNMPSNAWTDSQNNWQRIWLRAVATRWGDLSEAIVWILTDAGSNQGFHPEWGTAGMILHGTPEAYRVTHEAAHMMGSAHPWDRPWNTGAPNDTKLYDPATLAQVKPEQYWDLVYKPGTPNKFYKSEDDARPASASLEPIHDGNNCTLNGNGSMSCLVNGVNYFTGDSALKGIAFTFASAFGPNVSSYDALDNTTSHAFSDSQIARVRRYLRYEMPVMEPWKSEIMAGATGTAPKSGRPFLGEAHNREAAFKLDFDHDGRRDIGVWVPPTDAVAYGQFIVLLSTRGFSVSSGQYLSVQFGHLGDIPVPADYTGDGYADVAVFQPGNGLSRNDPSSLNGYWRWCPTVAADPTSTVCGHDGAAPSPMQFGHRSSVPLPGIDFDGNPATPELAYYRPSGGAGNGEWSWQTVSNPIPTARYLGGPSQMPLPGLYDADWKTDIAVYNPGNAAYYLARSQLNWSTLSQDLTTAYFGTQYVPQPNATPGWGYASYRSGVLPLAGVSRPLWVCNGYICWWEARRVFSLWSVDSGNWVTKWDIFGGGSPVICQWGIDIDIPIPGVDRDGDLWTDRAIYRGYSFSDNAWLCIRNSNAGSPACDGAQTNYALWGLNRPRNLVFSVSDMTGDGKAEILIVNPDTMTVNWLTSQSDYTISESRQIGNQRAEVL